jgi:hypothetical protein
LKGGDKTTQAKTSADRLSTHVQEPRSDFDRMETQLVMSPASKLFNYLDISFLNFLCGRSIQEKMNSNVSGSGKLGSLDRSNDELQSKPHVSGSLPIHD